MSHKPSALKALRTAHIISIKLLHITSHMEALKIVAKTFCFCLVPDESESENSTSHEHPGMLTGELSDLPGSVMSSSTRESSARSASVGSASARSASARSASARSASGSMSSVPPLLASSRFGSLPSMPPGFYDVNKGTTSSSKSRASQRSVANLTDGSRYGSLPTMPSGFYDVNRSSKHSSRTSSGSGASHPASVYSDLPYSLRSYKDQGQAYGSRASTTGSAYARLPTVSELGRTSDAPSARGSTGYSQGGKYSRSTGRSSRTHIRDVSFTSVDPTAYQRCAVS
jgi:hypothetical protein